MSAFNGFLNNLESGVFNPKGNLADWRHASRTFVNSSFRLAPKAKFLYHVAFTFGDAALASVKTFENKHKLEAGLLVKNAELPKFSAEVSSVKKYNRIKNIQTSLRYEPVNITFHDDNLGITTALLEAYYRYYFVDGSYGVLPIAYNKQYAYRKKSSSKTENQGQGSEENASEGAPWIDKFPADNTYHGSERNKYRFGLDNNTYDPFFVNIQISQLSRKTYTTYTLVNPIITNWQHGNLDYSDGAGTMENTITVSYEAVWYDRGPVEAGADGSPKGFGERSHYDLTPSPITLAGGGNVGLGGILSAGVDLFDYARTGKGFSSPIAAGLAAAQLIGNTRGLNLQQAGVNLAEGAIGAGLGSDVSGLANSIFPK